MSENQDQPVVPVDPEDPVDPLLAEETGTAGTGFGGFGAGLQVPSRRRDVRSGRPDPGHPAAEQSADTREIEGVADDLPIATPVEPIVAEPVAAGFDPHTPIDLADLNPQDVPPELAEADEDDEPAEPKRRIGLMIAAIVMGLALIGGVVGVLVYFSLRDRGSDTPITSPLTSIDASAAPSESSDVGVVLGEDARRLLPQTVGDFTLVSATETDGVTDAEQAWTGEYTDSTGATVEVTTTVWADAEQATAFAVDATSVLPPETLADSGILDGTVVEPAEDGSTPAPPAGTAQFWQFDSGTGVTTIVWTEAERAVTMSGPTGTVQSLFVAFPL